MLSRPLNLSDSTQRCAIAVFCRAPRLGEVKSRLARTHGEECALHFYQAALADTFAVCASVYDAQLFVCVTPPEATREELPISENVVLLPQVEGGLSEKIRACFAVLRAQGFEHILILGADSPDLPSARLERAFALLAESDLVFGPARDGGFYLMAARVPLPDSLFEDVQWSSETTLRQIETNLAREALEREIHWARLPFWADVDDADDLELLQQRLERGGFAPKVAEFLEEMRFAPSSD